MTNPVYKVLIFLKRRPGLSVADFRAYYEGHHAPLCRQYAVGVKRYMRRYIDPLPLPDTGEPPELEFDVVTELWFENKAIYDAIIDIASRGAFPEDVIEDEKRVFDRSKIRFARVAECDDADG